MQDALNEVEKPVKGSLILVLGVAYKKDISDMRESPALDIIHLLQEKSAVVSYHDPHVPALDHDGMAMTGETNLDAVLDAADCVVVATDHAAYGWGEIARRARVVVDTRHALLQDVSTISILF